MEQNQEKRLGLFALASVVISSMLAAGVYSLPQNMAATASVGAVILAWLVTGFGMYFIANSFRILSDAKPDLKAGIYMYARKGFGPFIGFSIAWGYWICQCCGNVGSAVIAMDALNYFFPPYFKGGNSVPAIIGASVLIWFFYAIVMRGIRQASFINSVSTILKIIPLFLFIIIMAFVFKINTMEIDFWGNLASHSQSLGSLPEQIKSTMLVTLWAFIGIESAVILSDRADNPDEIGPATFIGFLGCLVCYVLLSVLPFGFMTRAELALIPNPSTAGILEHVVGPWGSFIMNAGLLIAVLSSWLAWTIITAEVPFAAAKDGTFPKVFAQENKHGSASFSLLITSALMQGIMMLVYFSNNAWNTMLSITSVMVLPAYLTSMLFLWKICQDKTYPSAGPVSRNIALVNAVLATIFSIYLIYAAGWQYMLMAVIFLTSGIPFYIQAHHENYPNQSVFDKNEKIIAVVFILISILSIILFSNHVFPI